jgi:hypothetical protein
MPLGRAIIDYENGCPSFLGEMSDQFAVDCTFVVDVRDEAGQTGVTKRFKHETCLSVS